VHRSLFVNDSWLSCRHRLCWVTLYSFSVSLDMIAKSWSGIFVCCVIWHVEAVMMLYFKSFCILKAYNWHRLMKPSSHHPPIRMPCFISHKIPIEVSCWFNTRDVNNIIEYVPWTNSPWNTNMVGVRRGCAYAHLSQRMVLCFLYCISCNLLYDVSRVSMTHSQKKHLI
jgi:hypothetical protein